MLVGLVTTNRSDRGCLNPIALELKKRGHDAAWFRWKNDLDTPKIARAGHGCDWVVCGFDRREMAPIAYHCFMHGCRIAQPAAGDVRFGGGDERHRWAISSYASLLLPWTRESEDRCLNWSRDTNIGATVVYTGPTTWDHVPKLPKVNLKSIGVKKPFDLVLVNAPIDGHSLLDIVRRPKDYIWLPPCDMEDEKSDNGSLYINRISQHVNCEEVDHPTFLSLLSSCDRFFSNSSSIWYVAPKVLPKEKIFQIGLRNRYSELPVFEEDNKASERTVMAMENYDGC